MVGALLWGCLAAVMWAGASIAAFPAQREARFWPVLLWFFVCSAVVATACGLTADGLPVSSSSGITGSVASGLLFGLGSVIFFVAMARGNIAILVPIVACDGAVAALIAAATGATIAFGVAIALAVMVVGTFVLSGHRAAPTTERPPPLQLAAAIAAAFAFGSGFYVSGRVHGIQDMWLVAVARSVGVLVTFAICAVQGVFAVPRKTWGWIALAGGTDALGYFAFVKGAHLNLPVAAVATSQYAALSVVGGLMLFRERLGRRDVVGIALLVAAAATVAAQAN